MCVICGPQTPAIFLLLLLPFVPLQEVVAHWIAESRIAIEEIRLLTLKAAHSIDTLGSACAKKEVRTFGLPSGQVTVSPTLWAFQVSW